MPPKNMKRRGPVSATIDDDDNTKPETIDDKTTAKNKEPTPTEAELHARFTALERAVREVDDIEPSERLVLHTIDPETQDAGPARYSVPWKATHMSQFLARFAESAIPEGVEDLERKIYVGVPDIEGDALLLLAMYIEAFCDDARFYTSAAATTSAAAAAAAAPDTVKPNANNNGDDDDDVDNDAGSAIIRSRRAAAAAASSSPSAAAATTTGDGKVGALALERPYRPTQMEIDLTTAAAEPCLLGFERSLASAVCAVPASGDAMRSLRGLLCAGWFLQMCPNFLDLVGWLLSLRFRGKNVQTIKQMMALPNVAVRPDHL